MNNQSQIASKLTQLFGNPVEAAAGVDYLLELQESPIIRVPNSFPTPTGVQVDEFFIKAEGLELFSRIGENDEYGIDGCVWGVSRQALLAAQATFASN